MTETVTPRPTDPPPQSTDPIAITVPPVPPVPQPAPPTPPTLAPNDDAHVQATVAATAIPARALLAYMTAATTAAVTYPNCHLQWQFLAALGEIESHHGQSHGSAVGADGVVSPAIYGPALDGSRAGVVGSVLSADGRPARALGPMQFIPSTWAAFGNGGDPQDIDDAASAAASYVCQAGRDLGTEAGRSAAAFSYNHADWYVANVLAIYADYMANQPGISRPQTPPTGADPAATVTTGPSTGSLPATPAPTPAPPSAATPPPLGPPSAALPTLPPSTSTTTSPVESAPLTGSTSDSSSAADPPSSPAPGTPVSDPPVKPSILPTKPSGPTSTSPKVPSTPPKAPSAASPTATLTP